ncbi:MAG: hypothetical protein U0746_17035 [Gemmataceae bacterium]
MCQPPKAIDGAKVIEFAGIDAEVAPTDAATHRVGGEVIGPAAGLAIAQYDGADSFYLFYCDPAWQTLTDTWHPTIESARQQAEFEYRGVSSRWQRLA